MVQITTHEQDNTQTIFQCETQTESFYYINHKSETMVWVGREQPNLAKTPHC